MEFCLLSDSGWLSKIHTSSKEAVHVILPGSGYSQEKMVSTDQKPWHYFDSQETLLHCMPDWSTPRVWKLKTSDATLPSTLSRQRKWKMWAQLRWPVRSSNNKKSETRHGWNMCIKSVRQLLPFPPYSLSSWSGFVFSSCLSSWNWYRKLHQTLRVNHSMSRMTQHNSAIWKALTSSQESTQMPWAWLHKASKPHAPPLSKAFPSPCGVGSFY